MKKKILFVGFRGKEEHLSQGHECYLLTDKKDFRPEYSELFSQVSIVNDIFDWKEVKSSLDGTFFDAVLTRFEDFIVPAAAIAAEKNLPGTVFEKSVTFRNKFLMKEVFAAKKVPCANHALISTMEEAKEFLTRHDFPLILKQLSGVHSRFVAKVKSHEDLAATLARFQTEIVNEMASLHDQLYNHENVPVSPDPRTHFLLEEMLTGEELSIDAITVNGKHHFTPVCRYLTSEEVGIEDHHLPIRILPADYTPEQEEIILNTVRQALDALGADFCGSHSEVFFNRETNDCRLVEVAARSGGFRGEMFAVSTENKFDLHEACIQVALGNEVSVPTEYPIYTAVVEVFAPEFGEMSDIDISCLSGREDVQFVTVNKRVGDQVGPASRGGKYIIKFLLKGDGFADTLAEATKLLHSIRNSIVLTK